MTAYVVRFALSYKMEKWKIAVIAALLVSLVGFGWYSNQAPPPQQGTPSGTPLPSPYLGKMMPAWNFKTWSSKPISLASLKGKPALVEIFRIQCPHCQDAAPFMASLKSRYAPRGLQMLGIQSPGAFKDAENPENKWSNVQTWMKEYGTNYPVAFDEGSKYFQGTIKTVIFKGNSDEMRWPTTLLLDKTGRISIAHTGFKTDDAQNITKTIDLAVGLEKALPGSKSPAENAASLVKWLKAFIPDLVGDANVEKALTDDIAQRLK
ncbi:redoxin domain-containing protein [bacterium]|nr:MAG: redoxin domain-containing protein [bacterium]